MIDDAEVFKGAIHCAAMNLATVMCLYNALTWTERRERRLVINVMIYACLTTWETYHTFQHWHGSDVNGVPMFDP